MTAAGAADLPDISRREPAAQRVESAIATKAALLISLSATGRWVLTISRTFAMKKVHSEHAHGAAPVNAARASAGHGPFFLGPSQQGFFVVMATTSHGSPGHPAGASFGEGAMRRVGVLREHPLFFWASGHKNKGDIENRQPHQEHRRQQRGFGEELGNHKTHPKKHRGDHDGG